MRRVFASRFAAAVAASVATAVVVGGIAFATIPDGTTSAVSACYPTSGVSKGALRVIDYQAGARCKPGEALLTWPSRGFRWRGAWIGTTTFGINDVVQYNGAAYIAKVANTNVAPTRAGTWGLMAARGATGAPGPANVAALQGTPCTSGTIPGKTQVSVDPTSDAMSFVCDRPLATVGVTGGTLTKIVITNEHDGSSATCLAQSFCSFNIPFDKFVVFDMYGATSFHYTCRGLSTQVAVFDNVEYYARCANNPINGHYDIPVTIP